MIKAFLYEGFKGFEKAVLWLEKVTTMIGTNASGKSNAIEGIFILSELATGRDVSAIFDGTKNSESAIRGGAKGCCRFKALSFRLGCLVDWDDKRDLLYRVRIGVTDRITIDEETLYEVPNGSIDAINSSCIFKANAKTDGGDIRVEYANGKRGTNPRFSAIRSISVLAQFTAKLPSDTNGYEDMIAKINAVQKALRDIFILDPIPALMRGYGRIGDTALRRNCSNVSAVMYALKQKDPQAWEQFTSVVCRLPENEIKEIDFIKTVLNDVILIQKEENGKVAENIDAFRLSDGTLRCIAALAAVLSEPENSIIAIEELDNGIHPSRLKKLISSLAQLANQRHVELILTTHNATLLNGLGKEEIMGVSVVYRDTESKASCIIPFVEVPDQAGLLAVGGIGDALETESLLRAIKEKHPKRPFQF